MTINSFADASDGKAIASPTDLRQPPLGPFFSRAHHHHASCRLMIPPNLQLDVICSCWKADIVRLLSFALDPWLAMFVGPEDQFSGSSMGIAIWIVISCISFFFRCLTCRESQDSGLGISATPVTKPTIFGNVEHLEGMNWQSLRNRKSELHA